MKRRTLEQFELAIAAMAREMNERVVDLAPKSSAGTLSEDEQREYAEIVLMNDLMSTLRLQARDYWSARAAR